MMHIASADFYETVSDEIREDDFVLVEGVRIRGRSKPVYDLAAKCWGLVTQRESLIYPTDEKIINVDMPGKMFRERLGNLPIISQLKMFLLRYVIWIAAIMATDYPGGRNAILKSMCGRSERRHGNSLDDLITNQRDKCITENIAKFVEYNLQLNEELNVSIVFGASHMHAIGRVLRSLGFRVSDKTWMDLITPIDFSNGK